MSGHTFGFRPIIPDFKLVSPLVKLSLGSQKVNEQVVRISAFSCALFSFKAGKLSSGTQRKNQSSKKNDFKTAKDGWDEDWGDSLSTKVRLFVSRGHVVICWRAKLSLTASGASSRNF